MRAASSVFGQALVFFVRFQAAGLVGQFMALVEHGFFLNINLATFRAVVRQLHIIADLALQADISNQAAAGFRIKTGQVARVRVAVGIAVFHIKQQNKFITVGKSGHGLLLFLFLIIDDTLMIIAYEEIPLFL